MVPVFFSSANILIVRAGMKKKRVQYAMPKNSRRLACPIRKISEPEIQVKNPLKPRKRTIMMMATSESKEEFNSRLVIVQIVFIIKDLIHC
jgi:hypothetical protein